MFGAVLSFLLYSKPVEQLHIIGGVVFIASVLISMKLKTDKKKKPAGAPGAKAEGGYGVVALAPLLPSYPPTCHA